jgi:hypothetical protein
MTAEFGRQTEDLTAPVPFEELRASVQRVTGALLPDAEVVWAMRFPLATKLADEYRRGRVLLAGDAAHLFPAFGGERLNTCFDDAINLGWKLTAVVRGDAPAALLDSYQAERQPAGTAAAENVQAQVAIVEPAEKIAPLRELISRLVQIPEVNKELVDLVTGLGVRYPQPAEPSDTVGFRLSPAQLKEHAAVAESLRRGRGVLAYPGTEWLTALEGDWSGRLDLVDVADGQAMLVRPDGRVAFAGTDPSTLLPVLRTWFGELPSGH